MTGPVRASFVLALLLLEAAGGYAFDSHCGVDGVACADGVDAARQRWGVTGGGASIDERAEHARLWTETLAVSGLPSSLLEDLELPVFTGNATVAGHPTVAPVLSGATRRVVRVTSHAELTQLPDFSYTLWDWAAGNETCPPGALNPEVCHKYFPHIGMLNSNHMVPQAQRFYEHYHRLALQRAADCHTLSDDLTSEHRERFAPFVLACEKEALALEAVGQHFLQDAWSMGHMWERWGGPEFSDFGAPPLGERTLAAAVAAYTGIIHGGRSLLGEGFDDPMCAPHPGVGYIDGAAGGTERLGLGDVFLDEVLLPATGDAPYAAQRRAVFGCAVDGMRTVYAQTAKAHGPLGAAVASAIDPTRRVTEASCWGQRATNQALAIGFGLHVGTQPNQVPLLEVYPGLADPGVTNESFPAGILAFALSTFAPASGLPQLTEEQAERFARDAAAAASLAAAKGADPETALDTDLAAGGLPAIAGIRPNHHYARGSATEPPTTYADPFLPWTVFDADPDTEERTRALNLLFADAHAADRCGEFAEVDLLEYRALAEEAVGGNPTIAAARCGQCEQMVAPHLRFGLPVEHDERREAFCALVGLSDAAFVYTEEDPADFTGTEPTDLESLRAATREWCGCDETPTTTTSTTLPAGSLFPLLFQTSMASEAFASDGVDPAVGDDHVDGVRIDFPGPTTFERTLDSSATDGLVTASGTAFFRGATETLPGGGLLITADGTMDSSGTITGGTTPFPVSTNRGQLRVGFRVVGAPMTFEVDGTLTLVPGTTRRGLARIELYVQGALARTWDTATVDDTGSLPPGDYSVVLLADAEVRGVSGTVTAGIDATFRVVP